MRYEDASQTGSVGNDVNARDDADHLAANDFGPATGNLITGAGTITGTTGTDSGGSIVAIVGAGGSDDTIADGQLEVAGQYGTLTIDADGNYSYVRNPDSPEGVTDTFTYTLANDAGAIDTANLVINIGDLPILQAEGTQTIQTNNGVVVLPAGVELSDVRVVGRDLVITLPDGSTMVIPDGAVFVPQLVIDGVEVPASNLAALLIDAEPRPAAGDLSPAQPSGGGNFEVPVQPLDPGVPLGDLLPPTELTYTPPEFDDPGIEPEDNEPPLIAPSAVNVSEEGVATVAAPIPDNAGSPDTTNERIVNGHVTVVDPDGDSVVITLGAPSDSLTSQGVPITWSVSPDGHTVTGSAGGNTVITIVIENDGDYTVTLSRPVDHPNGGGEQGTSFVVPVFATDGEEPALPSSITVTIEDDSPVVNNVTVQGGVTLDETDAGTPAGFPISDTTDGAIIVNASGGFGADGPAAANSIVYGLGLTGGVSSLASGLATAIGDHAITLVQIDADTIQGQYADGGTQVAFIIQMNGDGSVTLTQNVPLEHLTDGPPGPAHDDSLDLSGLVNATVTYTDFDGDTANGSAPIGGGLIFRDDGPSVDGATINSSVLLDETDGAEPVSAGAPIVATSAAPIIVGAAVDYGADGQGPAPVFGLSLLNGSAIGTSIASGLATAAGDLPITLTLTSATLITGTYNGGADTAFTIQMNADGTITVTQLTALEHHVDGPPGPAHDDALDLVNGDLQNLVNATVTYQDSDGDTASASAAIGGAIVFEDDGPSIDVTKADDTNILLVTQDDGTEGAGSTTDSTTAAFAGAFAIGSSSGGGDGTASAPLLTYQLATAGGASGLTSQGNAINLYMVGTTVVGAIGAQPADLTDPDIVFTVSVDGAGVVTLTQLQQVDHPTEAPGATDAPFADQSISMVIDSLITLTASATITDNDGDTAIDSETINIAANLVFQDDGPTIEAILAANASVHIDESLPGVDGPGETDAVGLGQVTVALTAIVNVTENPISADQPTTVTGYALVLGAAGGDGLVASGLTTSAGDLPIYLYLQGDGSVVGSTALSAGAVDAGNTVFTVAISGGNLVMTQYQAVEHPIPGASHDENTSGLAANALQLEVTATDFDGDTDSDTVDLGSIITFGDDGPNSAVNGQAALDTAVLDETRPEGTDTDDGSPVATPPSGDASETLNFADNFLAPDFGSDGPGSVTYQLLLSADGIGSGLYALQAGDTSASDGDGYGQGAEITLSQVGNIITGSAGGTDYFTISIDSSTGVVTFTQINPIWHPIIGDFDEQVTLTTDALNDIQVQQTVTDSDGDVDTAAIGIGRGVFSIQDDGPDPYEPCPDDVISVNDPDADPFTGSLNLPDVGEDEPGVVTFGVETGDPVLDTDGNPVTSGDEELVYVVNGNVLEAHAGDTSGDLIFTITLNGDGTFTYDQIGPIGSGGETVFDDLTSSAAGNVDYRAVGQDDPATAVDLILSGSGSGGADESVNTDSDSIGVDNQSMDVGETVRIDFVSNLQTSAVAAGTPMGLTYDARVETSSYLQTIPQVQGTQTNEVAFQVWALDSSDTQADEPDRDPAGGFANSTSVAITSATAIGFGVGESTAVTIDISGVAVGVWTDIAYGISVQKQADGSVIFTGVQEGDQYGIGTGSNTFNAVAVQAEPEGVGPVGNQSNEDSFDLGVFAIGTTDAFEPVDLEVPIVLTDADGDPVICEIDIHVGPPVDAPDIAVTVNEAGLPVIGSDAASDSEIQSGDLQSLVSGGTGPYTFTLVSNGDGTFGTLVLNADGTFTYTLDTPFDSQPDANDGTNPELGAESFTFEATDSLGATQTGTITINIIDDVPSVSVSGVEPTLTVDDTTLGTDASASFAGIFVPTFGADGPGSPAIAYTLGVSAPGADSGLDDVATGNSVFLFLEAGVVVGREGSDAVDAATGTVVFTVSVNGSGVVTLDQQRAVEHNDANDPVESGASAAGLIADNLITLTATVEDGDGDLASATANIGSNLSFEDDGPSVTVSGTEPQLTVDDTTLGTNASASFAGIFVPNFGADGQGSPPVAYALGVSAPGADSGLDDVATGNSVFLFLEAGVVVGREGTSALDAATGAVVFTVSVNGSGLVTLDQQRAVEHNDPNDPVESGVSAAGLATDNLITLTATVEDGDGDTATATANIGANLHFEDDGPSVIASGAEPTLTVDDTTLGTNASASFAGLFIPNYGADGQGSPPIAYALGVAAPGADSGLNDVATGNSVFLFLEAGVVVGREGTDAVDAATGAVVFTVSVNGAGLVTLDQQRAIEHDNPADPVETGGEAETLLADNLITLTATVEDGDGDTATATVNIGSNLAFEDDGPAAADDTDTVGAPLTSATGNVITDASVGDAGDTDSGADDVGADEPGSVVGVAVGDTNAVLNSPGTVGVQIQGAYGKLTLNSDGSYTYTRDADTPGGVDDVFTYTLSDADGDTVTATLTITIADEAPVAGTEAATVDDDGLASANPGGTNDIDANVGETPSTNSSEAIYNGTLNATGGDGDLDFSLVLPAGNSTIGQETVSYSLVANVLTATIATSPDATRVGDPLFTVSLDPDTGNYVVTLVDNVLHGDDANNDEDGVEVQVTIPYQVEDADGSPSAANGQLTISFNDDVPSASASGTQPDLTTDDTTLGTNASSSFAGVFTTAFGADGPALANSTAYALGVSAPGVDSGVNDVATGNSVFLFLEAGVVVGREGTDAVDAATGDVVFTVSVNGSGVVTLDQQRAVEHNDPNDPVESGASAAGLTADNLVTLTATVTDADGDQASATANIGSNLHFEDAGPSVIASGAEPTLTVDDTTLGTNASASFAGLFIPNYGADGQGSPPIAYALGVSAPGVDSGVVDVATGNSVFLFLEAGIVVGREGTDAANAATGDIVFTVSVNGSGLVTLDQQRAVEHNDPTDPFESGASAVTLAADNLVTLTATVEDGDGDMATATVNIGSNLAFEDDGPQAIQPDAAVLSNEIGATATEDLDDDGEVLTDFGADGPGLVQFANIANGDDSGFDSDGDDITYWLSNNGQTLEGRTNSTDGVNGELVFTVQINQASGDYTVTMAGTVDNGSGVTFDNLTSSKAGNVDVRGVGADDPATAVDLLLTASGPGGVNSTINTDSDSIGSGNQSMDEGETVRIDFVTNLQDDPTDNLATFPSGFSYDGHVGTSTFLQTIPQVQGSQTATVAFRVYALNTTVTDAGSPDDTPADGFASDSSIVAITSVTVDGFDVGQTPVTVAIGPVGTWTTIAYGVSARLETDGSVTFTGIQEGDQYGIETGTDFNAVAVTSLPAGVGPVGNVSSTNSFDLGVFAIGSVDTGEPVELSFDLSITDADGDTIVMPDAIDITLNPAAAAEALPLAKTSGPSVMEGLSSTSSLLVSETQEVERVAANSNSVTLAAAVAAAGMAASSAAAAQDFGGAEFSAITNAVAARQSFADSGFDTAYNSSAFDIGGAWDGGFSSSAQALSSSSHTAIVAGNIGELATDLSIGSGPTSLLEATDFGAMMQAVPAPSTGMNVAMPSADALMAMSGGVDAQQATGSVEQIIADALQGGGSAASIDALLNALPSAELGAESGLNSLATPVGDSVPTWDTGHGAVFTFDATSIITSEAMVLHHDAVQPVANG